MRLTGHDRWNRWLCSWWGHPRFQAPAPRKGGAYADAIFGVLPPDLRPRCVRCGVPDPALPEPGPYTHSFSDSRFPTLGGTN